jgi:hypothetical protein
VWANKGEVSHTFHEFMFDFIRLDGTAAPPGRGVLVSRVSLPPALVSELLDSLQREWRLYAEKTFPREVRESDEGSQETDR